MPVFENPNSIDDIRAMLAKMSALSLEKTWDIIRENAFQCALADTSLDDGPLLGHLQKFEKAPGQFTCRCCLAILHTDPFDCPWKLGEGNSCFSCLASLWGKAISRFTQEIPGELVGMLVFGCSSVSSC